MLSLYSRSSSRREFLRVGALSGLGISLPLWFKQRSLAAAEQAKDANCILIWTQGGTSHHDTLDPKPEAPLSVKGPYSMVQTTVPGVVFTEVCPKLAANLDRYSLMRSWNPQNGSHGIADQFVMSGRAFNPAVTYPCFGSVVSHEKGFKTAMPPFMQLGSSIDRRFGGGTCGFLGLEHNPFEMLADPSAKNFTVRDITPPQGVNMARIDRRKRMLSAFDEAARGDALQQAAFDALDEHYKAALNMITAPSTKAAFEIESEDPKLRERYGQNRLGQSLLLARRLIEAGVRFVTVTDGGWDTHQGNFESLKSRLMPRIDDGLTALLADLSDRGMLDSTLVLWLTDFGRTPKINSASGRDHWATAGFVVAAGAGIPGGTVVGATDDEGGKPIRDEYTSSDVAHTVYEKLGIPHDLLLHAQDGRPIILNEGRPVREWM